MKSHLNIKNIIIQILIMIIFILFIKNTINRKHDREILHIEFQKFLDKTNPSVRNLPPKIEV